MSRQDVLRRLPSVDAVASHGTLAPAVERHGRALVTAQARREIDAARQDVLAGSEDVPDSAALAARAARALEERARGALREVVNATGVVVHTNLGRAPLGRAALERAARACSGAVDLEMDLGTGRRGRRASGCEDLLASLTGAEAALVVNNCAAALLLALNTFARGKRVVVSRGELVEIGGSFRIPDVCERSGATLAEVGTTNRTRLADYERAAEGAGLLLKVHPSNFRVVGFTEEASIEELADLARRTGIPLLVDQGSGALEDLAPWGVADERPARDVVAAGAGLVTFSGDKLLGGPQAGCMAGRRTLVDACRANPLYRALRVGRLVSSALEATLWAHASGRVEDVPVQAQLRAAPSALEARARRLLAAVQDALRAAGAGGEVTPADSTSGGGSSPGSRLPTFVLRVTTPPGGCDAFAARLRAGVPAVVARIADGAVVFDPRTVPEELDEALAGAIAAAVGTA